MNTEPAKLWKLYKRLQRTQYKHLFVYTTLKKSYGIKTIKIDTNCTGVNGLNISIRLNDKHA
jgi:hypothetical protein